MESNSKVTSTIKHLLLHENIFSEKDFDVLGEQGFAYCGMWGKNCVFCRVERIIMSTDNKTEEET